MTKKNLIILFGGKSTEHEISVLSAEFVYRSADRSTFNPILVQIDKSGKWNLMSEDAFKGHKKGLIGKVFPAPFGKGTYLIFTENVSKKIRADVFFPVLHGPLGEDGTVQGLFKMLDVPFVGSGVLGSALSMDKEASKKLLFQSGLPVCRYLSCGRNERVSFKRAVKELGLPMFVKPSSAGSSVGVGKVKNEKDYYKMKEEAHRYCDKIIFEEFVEGREIECAVLGNQEPIASVPGEIVLSSEFYSYEAKYILKDAAEIVFPADLPKSVSAKIRSLAVEAFNALYCEGMARVDFFFGKRGIYINELNTIPGFTSISMYPKLWEASGIGSGELIGKLVELAFERHQNEKVLLRAYKR
ncbi:D-alanine--D-alanine ligase [candidate division WOR-3 bacterium]|nr:D-alanine--D-alanine ligase [candidate division WOR-3 bacterium]